MMYAINSQGGAEQNCPIRIQNQYIILFRSTIFIFLCFGVCREKHSRSPCESGRTFVDLSRKSTVRHRESTIVITLLFDTFAGQHFHEEDIADLFRCCSCSTPLLAYLYI
jgi:hypothetical protein